MSTIEIISDFSLPHLLHTNLREVSSPDEQFIRYLYDILQVSAGRGTEINIVHICANILSYPTQNINHM
jgi:hypothetical protein